MAATSKTSTKNTPRSNGRFTKIPPATISAEPEVEQAGDALEAPAEEAVEPVVFGIMTPQGYVPRSHIERVHCSVYEPDLTLYVHFNTSIAYGFLNTGYEMPGKDDFERGCRRMAMLVADIEGWNFYDPFLQQPVPKPDPSDWASYRPLVAASGICIALGTWINGRGLLSALNQSMGNSTTA